MQRETTLLLGLIVSVLVTPQAMAQPHHTARHASARPGGNSVTIVNRSSQTMIEAYGSPASDESWGKEALDNTPVPVGGSRTLALQPTAGCSYQVHVVYDSLVSEDATVNGCGVKTVTFDGTRMPDAEAGAHDVTVTNQSGHKLNSIYLVPSRQDNWRSDRNHWGEDALGDGRLDLTGSKTISVLGCSADLRVVYASLAAEERTGIDICKTAGIALTPGWSTRDPIGPVAAANLAGSGPVPITVSNKTGKTIMDLHLYPDGSDEHGHELLGTTMLEDGATTVLNVIRGTSCKFTLEISGSRDLPNPTRPGIDLCARKDIAITVSGKTEASVRNAGATPVVALYVDAPGAPQGPDRLANDVIPRGHSFTVVLPDEAQCAYSVTAVFRNGQKAVRSADLCGSGEVTLN